MGVDKNMRYKGYFFFSPIFILKATFGKWIEHVFQFWWVKIMWTKTISYSFFRILLNSEIDYFFIIFLKMVKLDTNNTDLKNIKQFPRHYETEEN